MGLSKKKAKYHAELRPGELTAHYRHLRHKPLPADLEPDGRQQDREEEFPPCDRCWDYLEPATWLDHAVLRAWNHLLAPGRLSSMALQWPETVPCPCEGTVSGRHRADQRGEIEIKYSKEELPAALLRHLASIELDGGLCTEASFSDVVEPLARQTEDRLGWLGNVDSADLVVISELGKRINSGRQQADSFDRRIFLALILAPFWVRSPRSWEPPDADVRGMLRSFFQHLFALYPVPEFIYRSLANSAASAADLPNAKWVAWLVLLGQGASLRKCEPLFRWDVGKGFLASAMKAPEQFTALETCMWVEVMRLGGSDREFQALRANPAYVADPTSWMPGDPFGKFWRTTVKWFVRYRAELTEDMREIILDWGMHMYTEQEAQFSWSGRTPKRAYQAGIEYRTLLSTRGIRSCRWPGHGWNWEGSGDGDGGWTVRELTTSIELEAEGNEMRHCVVGYAWRCERGESAIFSLCSDGCRRITIEADPRSRRVVQARGQFNRSLDQEESKVLHAWENEVLRRGTVAPAPVQMPKSNRLVLPVVNPCPECGHPLTDGTYLLLCPTCGFRWDPINGHRGT